MTTAHDSKPDTIWRAVVLAASRGPDDPLARATGVRHKCLLPVAEEPMLARVVRALRADPRIKEIAVVIDDFDAAKSALGTPLPESVRLLPAGESAAASADAAVAALAEEGSWRPVLLTTGDHALLTPDMVRLMLNTPQTKEADLFIALARRSLIRQAYPDMRRTWLKLCGEAVTSCNLFALMTPRARRALQFWKDAERNRKHPLRLAFSFGLGSLLRLAFCSGGAERALAILGKALGLAAAPVFMPWAEGALDVDKPEDYALVQCILDRADKRP
ncbi:NTP transferase domain-containing protein [Thermopetrobacter sp. TC1]|uniref:NTP transferase domain-containing protein n=1 Tax=Thermopetrobacter sp. TC1 TaxID=1495045 RepID=UPI00068BA12D|nr:NTP transferase domain-containing protein [Thermopetrobacter sp. TC1]